jgi:electron transfer flavoprotein-quinone oxidoreductase
MMPQLYTDGMLVAGDAAALCFVAGLYLEGINYAIQSGIAAAETALLAHERDDFSKDTLSQYEARLTAHHVLSDFRSFRAAPAFVNSEQMQNIYPAIITHAAEQIFRNDGSPKKKLIPLALETLRKYRVSPTRLLKDLHNFWRALGW